MPLAVTSWILALAWSNAWAVPDVCDEGYGSLALPEALTASDISVYGYHAFDNLGWAMADIGDFDGDGVHDLAVGVPGDHSNGPRAGAVFVYLSDGGSHSLLFPSMRVFGAESGDGAGSTVAGAGDVNGDGYDDLVIGASPNSRSHHVEGVAWLVLGTPSAPATLSLFSGADATWRGAGRGDRFGSVVAGLGDVNGDGFDDVGVGAPRADGLGLDAGAVYVFYGPQTGDRSALLADRTLLGATAGDAAGSSLMRLGDVDGDLDADFAVGAPLVGSLSNDGAVYIVTAGVGTLVLTDAAATLRGAAGEHAGSALADAGDVDGDGANELWVGARAWGRGRRGAVYLVNVDDAYGAVDALSNASVAQLRGVAAGDAFGVAIAGGEDVDDDGVMDLIVGAPGARGAGRSAGAAWVLSGPFSGSVDVTSEGQHNGSVAGVRAGSSVALMPDLNGDAFADALIGSPRFLANGRLGVGELSVFYGGADRVDLQTWFADGDHDGWGAGAPVASCLALPGHVARTGDCDDSSQRYHPYAAETDCADIEDYSCDGSHGPVDVDNDGVFACANDCDDRDPAVAAGQPERCANLKDDDCNGEVDDGLAIDAVLWRPDSDRDGFGDAGVAFLACSAPGFFLTPPVTVSGDCDDLDVARHPGVVELCDLVDNDCDGLVDGWSAIDALDAWPDADGDGGGSLTGRQRMCEVAEGFATEPSDCDDSDAAVPGEEVCDAVDNDCDGAFYLGGEVASPTWSISGQVPPRGGAAQLGVALAVAPDMDGDGYDELVMGASNASVYVLAQPPATGPHTILAPSVGGQLVVRATLSGAGAAFGSVLAAGDFDGDGIGDVAVADPAAAAPLLEEGIVYLFYGPLEGALTTGAAAARVVGVSGADRVGSSLVAADLDGDGADELVVGAPGADLGLHNRGAMVVVAGDPLRGVGTRSIDDLPGLLGEAAGDELGSAVAVLGDVDGDGQRDIACAARFGTLTDAGYVAVVSAQSVFAKAPDVDTVYGFSPGQRLGRAIAGGDVDGDGYDDLIVSDALGRAWVVPGSASGVVGGSVTSIASHELTGPPGQELGATLAVASDVDADGDDELVVGAPGADGLGVHGGAIFVVYGSPNLPQLIDTSAVESFGRVEDGTAFPTFSARNLGGVEGAQLLGASGTQLGGALLVGVHTRAGGRGDIVGAAHGVAAGLVLGFATGPYGLDVPSSAGPPLLGAVAFWPDLDGDGQAVEGAPGEVACLMHAPNVLAPAPRLAVVWDGALALDCDDQEATVFLGAPDLVGSTVEDCALRVYGCTDPLAVNYAPGANTDDQTCDRPGCTDGGALNYEPLATIDDGSCRFLVPCDGTSAVVTSAADLDAIYGCTSLGSLTIEQTDLLEVDLPWLVVVSGSLNVRLNPELTSLRLRRLHAVGGAMVISANDVLTSLDFASLNAVGGGLQIDQNPSLCVDDAVWSPLSTVYLSGGNATCP